MRASDLRRFESMERSLDSSSIDALEPFTPTQLVAAWKNRTATPLHMRQIYEIGKRDMEIAAFQEGIKRRVDLDLGRGRKIVWPFDVLAELLRYRSDQDPGFNLEWRPYDPNRWKETEPRSCSIEPPLVWFEFTMWADSALVEHLVDHDPLALEFRRRLDNGFDGWNPPVDFSRYLDSE